MYDPRLRDLREDHDLVQKEAAAELGIDQHVYSKYETGKREIPTGLPVKLADYYHTSTDYLRLGERIKLNRVNKAIAPLWCVLWLIVMLLGGCAPREATPMLELHVFDVGHADCFLIKHGDHAMLIDAGNPEDADPIVSYLFTQGVTRLEAMVLSHPHMDHIGSAARVIEAYKPPVLYYADVPEEVESTTVHHTRLFEAARRAHTEVQLVSTAISFSLGGAQVTVFGLEGPFEDGNEYSLFVKVVFGNERLLFTGDATAKAQNAAMRSGYDLSATVLKVSHHGGKITTTRAFLDAVHPKAAIISCGADNPYNHPHEDTLTALEERGIATYRTDLSGTMVMRFDGVNERFIETAR